MTDVDCKLTVLVAACTLYGFCLLPLAPPTPLVLSPFSLSASRLSYSFSAGKVKCCLLPLRSEGTQGYSEPPPPHPPPHFVATMRLAASSPARPPASGGSNGSRPGCGGMCLSPAVSSFLSSSQLLQVDLFSMQRTERGPVFLQDSSRDHFTMFMVKSNDK